jgi:hypothetical protein
MMPDGNFDVDDRRREKELSRQHDEQRLARGEISASQVSDQNAFFSVLDRSKAKLLIRRARILI